nr:shikimate kinase [Pontibacter silvestris]
MIFLIGLMGAGKTTLGRQLAQELSYPFVDLDDYIVQRENRSIAALFEQEGQERFRQIEHDALKAVADEFEKAVISTGGGAPCFHNNMALINEKGTSIFLDVSVEELVHRLRQSDLSVRPLLAGRSEAELKAFIAETLESRRQYYELADYKLETSVCSVEAITALLNN